MSTAGDIDPKKNYYAVLELGERATLEEIKSSYIKLALLYHPDTGKQKASGEVDVGAKFRNISEAFTVLSKPALRERYHALRGIKDGADVESFANSAAAGDYSAQKIHFTNMVQHRANADDIKNMTDKYKSQRWQKMTLAEKKVCTNMSNVF